MVDSYHLGGARWRTGSPAHITVSALRGLSRWGGGIGSPRPWRWPGGSGFATDARPSATAASQRRKRPHARLAVVIPEPPWSLMSFDIYPSDLSDSEWDLLEPLLPAARPGGRPRSVDLRRILNGIFYVLRSGCAWRYVPASMAMVHGVPLFSPLAPPRRLGADSYRAARAPALPPRARGYAERGDHRQSIGQNDRTGRTTRLRRREKAEWTQPARRKLDQRLAGLHVALIVLH
jgi:transposase